MPQGHSIKLRELGGVTGFNIPWIELNVVEGRRRIRFVLSLEDTSRIGCATARPFLLLDRNKFFPELNLNSFLSNTAKTTETLRTYSSRFVSRGLEIRTIRKILYLSASISSKPRRNSFDSYRRLSTPGYTLSFEKYLSYQCLWLESRLTMLASLKWKQQPS